VYESRDSYRISGHGSEGKWACDRDYHNGTGPVCLDIDHRIIDEPLTKEFLKCLDLSSHATAVLDEVQNRTLVADDEQIRRKREESQLKSRLSNLENYLVPLTRIWRKATIGNQAGQSTAPGSAAAAATPAGDHGRY